MSAERQVKGVAMTREVVNQLFCGDVGVVAGMPDDASFRRMYTDASRDMHVFVFQSDEFDVVGEAEKIPIHQIAAVTLDYERRKGLSSSGNYMNV